MKFGVGTRVGAGPVAGGRLPYPSQCGSTDVESLSSLTQYYLPTIRERVTESQEQLRGLEADITLSAGIDVPLS